MKTAVEDVNKDNFPEGTDVTVNEDGSATITYPDGSKDSIPAEELIYQDAKGDPEEIEKPELPIADIIDPALPERTKVGDVDDLTKSEREHVKDAVKDANKDNFPEGTDVTINEDGSATITYPDGSKDSIPADQLIYADEEVEPTNPSEPTDPSEDEEDSEDDGEESTKSLAEEIDVQLPAKTGVNDINKLTDVEKETVKIAIHDANDFPEGTEVLVGEKGDAIINYPDGSHDVIAAEDLVYQLAGSDQAGADSQTPGSTDGSEAGESAGQGSADQEAGKTPVATEAKDGKSTSSSAKSSDSDLPETGEADNHLVFGAAALSILAGLGLVAPRRKEEE